MRYLRYLLILGALIVPVSLAQAQVGVGIGIGPGYGYGYGPAPVCSYGYYDYYPYACAPYGYYGPSWFLGGVFIGAGPWYRGYWGPPTACLTARLMVAGQPGWQASPPGFDLTVTAGRPAVALR